MCCSPHTVILANGEAARCHDATALMQLSAHTRQLLSSENILVEDNGLREILRERLYIQEDMRMNRFEYAKGVHLIYQFICNIITFHSLVQCFLCFLWSYFIL